MNPSEKVRTQLLILTLDRIAKGDAPDFVRVDKLSARLLHTEIMRLKLIEHKSKRLQKPSKSLKCPECGGAISGNGWLTNHRYDCSNFPL